MSRPTSWLRARVTRLAVLMTVGALALTGCDFSVYSLPLPGGADLGDDPYEVTVEFRDVLDLVPQTSVKVDDVTVGTVEEIDVEGQHAVVTVKVRKDVKLPDNAEATIRQTSLLGEKFVSLAPPESGVSRGRLGDGDTIPLERSGRNPEVEEVLGALSLLLNGGGVAQLKTIASELNKALDGREANVKSVLSQLDEFMGQLDTNKDQIVRAIESLNRLAIALNKQKPSITQALDELPRAVASVDRQRDDLVKMLRALADLSSIGTQVIRDSKTATIDSLQALAPTLTKLAETGDALPKALQVFLTYPFVDAVVGTNPAQARNLHMGDYTNLSIRMDLSLDALATVTEPVCRTLDALGGRRLCGDALEAALACLDRLPSAQVGACTRGLLTSICNNVPRRFPDVCGRVGPVGPVLTQMDRCVRSRSLTSPACRNVTNIDRQCRQAKYRNTLVCRLNALPLRSGTGGGTGGLGDLTGGLTGGGGGGLLNRPGFGAAQPSGGTEANHDGDLAAMLVWGMMER